MTDISKVKCPYCGYSLLPEEDGYRCRFCKSFFPLDSSLFSDQGDSIQLSEMKEQVIEQEITPAEQEKMDAEKEMQRFKMRHELVGIAAAFSSLVLLFLSKTMSNPYLMIPGFILWAFSAGYTAFQVYRSTKKGKRILFIRVFLLLIIAILVVLFMKPAGK